MDQISPPFRIAIAAMLAVCALWFTVLRPKPPADDAPLPTAPGVTGLAHDVNAAKGAAAKSDAADKATEAATGGSSASTATATGGTAASTAKPPATATAKGATAAPKAAAKRAVPAAKTNDPAAPLISAVDSHRVVVLLFWDRKGSDDRAVRRAVAATAHHHGKVVVKIVPVSQVGRYGAITRGAQVLQSPTTLVLAPGNKARAIVGLTTTSEVDQAVGDALAGK